MSKLLIGLIAAGAFVVVVGSGALDNIGRKLKNLPSLGGSGGVDVENTVITDNPMQAPNIPQGHTIEGAPVITEGGAQIVKVGAIDVRSISQKSADTLQRFKSPNPDIVSDIRLFRELQLQQLSNVSTGRSVILTDEQIAQVAARPFTSQELADQKSLDARRTSAGAKAALKLSGADTVIAKRLEEERARIGVFDSKSVQNPNFDLGLPSTATAADRAFAIKQQQENKQRQINAEVYRINREADETIGGIIKSEINQSGQTEQDYLLSKGINLHGSTSLSARTLGILQARGLI